ncbi:hypothetical protein E4T47_03874 [Aureobasidium subglaciale]|nr:hypothetical protein E4T47_03874 [Aureobasidium subglaciale]
MAPWNDTEDRKMLLYIIANANVTSDWDMVATHLNKTKDAVRQRFMKLKKEAGDLAAGSVDAKDGGGTAAAAATASTRKRKGKATMLAEDDEDDVTPIPKKRGPRRPKKVLPDNEEPTPSAKKTKKALTDEDEPTRLPKKKAKKVNSEEADADEDA